MNKKFTLRRINRYANLLKKYLNDIHGLVIGRGIMHGDGFDAAANNYVLTFNTAKQLADDNRDIKDLFSILKVISYNDIKQLYSDISKYVTKIKNSEKKEKSLVGKFEELLQNEHIVTDKELFNSIKEIIEDINTTVFKIEKIKSGLKTIIEDIRHQEIKINRHTLNSESKKFILDCCVEAEKIRNKVLFLKDKFLEDVSELDGEVVYNANLVSKLNKLI